MKKIYSIIGLTTLLYLSSCENVLTPKPTDFLSPTNYYQTEDHLNFALASVYHTLGDGSVHGLYGNYAYGWVADEGLFQTSNANGSWTYAFSTADTFVLGFWRALYVGINRANVLLANLDRNPEISQSLRDRIRGEVLFLRGYFHFMLVQYYGGVPVKTEPTASIEAVDAPKNTIREVYDQILQDMEAAEPLVPTITSLGFGGAVNKSAVRGILARVNLVMAGHPLKDESRYAEAKRWAKVVIDDQTAAHAMNPSYHDIFIKLAADRYDIKESLFEVEFWGNQTDQFTEVGGRGWHDGPFVASGAATGKADGYMRITAKLYNIFEPGDLRKFWSISHFAYRTNQENGSKALNAMPTTEVAKYAIRPAKYRREYETLIPKSENRTPQNVCLLRFTDVLMMYAEAENAINGPTAEAVGMVNAVRRRGWSTGIKTLTIANPGTGYTSAPTVTFSGGAGTEHAVATTTFNATSRTVTGITLSRDATGIKFFDEGRYTSAPTVTLTGGGGTGATAVATIYTPEDADLKPEQYASKSAFLAAIQDERMREFSFELLRKADLLRWGIFSKVLQEMGDQSSFDAPGTLYSQWFRNAAHPKHTLWPIPSAEITLNQLMTQNPGWE